VGRLKTEVTNQLRKMLRSHTRHKTAEHTTAVTINLDKLTDPNSWQGWGVGGKMSDLSNISDSNS